MTDAPEIPSREKMEEIAERHNFALSEQELVEYEAIMGEVMGTYERLAELSDPQPGSGADDREPGYRPDGDEDPLNAFITKTDITDTETGPLADYDIGIKDNVSVASVPMTCGSEVLSEYVPSTDATIVSRILDAGGTVAGKLNMEDFAFSGSGELSAYGPVVNPRSEDHLAGGSSSGSAAAVVAGDVDMAIGGDQAGSIRIPASWSGCVGHKPTYSLVPYTGIVGLGRSFDHTGPLAMSTEDCARLLEVIAGEDRLDPRQGAVPTENYLDALDDDPGNLTIGVVEEGFDREASEDGVDKTVRTALDHFEERGATITDVSIPMHVDGLPIWNGVANEGTTATINGEGIGHFAKGHYDRELMEAFAAGRRERANYYPPTIKFVLVLGQYLAEEYHSQFYAKAQNLTRGLSDAYDEALADVDVLAMPTTPQTAHERLENPSRPQLINRAVNMIQNTCPFDVTGHPAVSIPAGTSDGLPVGLMFVGETFDDATVLRAAHAFEQNYDWQSA